MMARHVATGLLAMLAVSLFISGAAATDPRLSNISPQGGQRGTEVEVRFAGSRLNDAQELLFTSDQFEVKKLEADGDNAVKAVVAIKPECRLGIHGVRVRTATGVSDLRTFHVGALPVLEEKEPNNEFESPQEVPLDHTITGVVQNEDVDYFVVSAKKGQRITAEIEGLRLGRTFFDPYLEILDSQRFVLASSDDAALLYQDAVCSVVAPQDGTYIIQVRESAYQGSGACTYRLHLGHFPRPLAVYPPGGQPGETLKVRFIGDPAGDWEETVTLPTDPDSEPGLFAKDAQGVAPSATPIRVAELPGALEAEPNDAVDKATAASAPGALHGVIEKAGDVDFFKFAGKKGDTYEFRVHARSLRSPLDSILEIWQGDRRVQNNDDSGGPDSYVRYRLPADGDYAVAVRDHLGAGGPHYVYRVEITPVKPELTVSLPERQRYVATRVAVRRGNRTAVMVSAKRDNFRAPLKLGISNLPAGVKLEAIDFADNQNQVPMILHAASDAPLAGVRADLTAHSTDEKVQVRGGFRQQNLLVRGQGNREVWSYYDDRMPLVVADRAPYTIELVQPKVPLVRNGQMKLKVVAQRDEGFTAPIAVRMLYNPPGTSSSGSVKIEQGKTEAEIPISAGGNAALGKWPVVVTGASNVEGGNMLVSTQFAELEIAEPYFALGFPKSAVEQGKPVEFVVEVENKTPFEGAARVELIGLPPGASAEPMEMTKETKTLSFQVKTEEKARVGRHKNVLCRATVIQNGEPVLHQLGSGELRIDKPLPPKKDEPKKTQVAKADPKPQPEKKPEKPLSRLEQLRQQREQATQE